MTWEKSTDNKWKDRNKENWKFKQWWAIFAILRKDLDKFCPLTLSFQPQFKYKWDMLSIQNRCLDRAVFTWLSKGIGFGFGFTTPFGWLVYLLWFWFYDSQVKTALSLGYQEHPFQC